jgi:hypothetical protein
LKYLLTLTDAIILNELTISITTINEYFYNVMDTNNNRLI